MGSSRIDRSALSGDIEMKAIPTYLPSSISFFDTNDEIGTQRLARHYLEDSTI